MQVSRRTLLALASLSPLAAAPAAAKLGKGDVNYQLKPNGSARCGLCKSLRAGASSSAPGACVLVEGPIPPSGWCVLFAPRK
jgi:hypothetical protein